MIIIDDADVKQEVKEEKSKPDKKKKGKAKIVKGKAMLSFIPFRRIISEDCIALEDGVTDYFSIEEVAVRNGSQNDKATAIEEFWDFLRVMEVDCKFILTNNPTDVAENIDYAKRRFQLTESIDTDYIKEEKEYSLRQLEYLNSHYLSGEIYLQVFADDHEEMKLVQNTVLSSNGLFFRVQSIPLARKVRLIHSLYNFGDSSLPGIPYTGNDEDGRPAEIQKVVDKKGYDPIFICQIQPIANLGTKSCDYLRTNQGYLKTLHVTAYKKKGNPLFYGENVFKFANTTTSIDIFNVDKSSTDFERSLNRSLNEYEDRIESSKDRISRKKAASEYRKLDETIDTIIEDDEALKQIHVRIFLHEPSLDALADKEQEVLTKLKKHGFHAHCFIDEAETEYRALFVSFTENQKQRKRKGQEIRAFMLAGSYFFSSAKLVDPNALYTGYALYGSGLVVLNQFHKDRSRKSYGGLYIGNQGFGKSTEIKATAKTNRLLGNNTFLFMVSNEAERLVKACGGLHFDAREPKINPCQIYSTDFDIQSNQTKDRQYFITNVTKMKIILSMAANLSQQTTNSSQKYITDFYKSWVDEYHLDIDQITTYDPEQYPLYSNVLEYAKNQYQSETDQLERQALKEMIGGLETVVDTYGDIFNVHTEFSLDQQKLVAFNLESLLNIQDSDIYNAQYFNLYNMVYSHAVRVGQQEKYLYTTKQKKPSEIIFTDIVSDEFHNPIRTRNVQLLNQMDRNNREGRKIFIAQHYAVHDIKDCFIDMDDNGRMGPVSQAVMNLYKLSTYRFIYRQDASSLDTLRKVFGKEISESDLQAITRLKEGQSHLNIKGTTNIQFKREVSKRDLEIFEGSI
ncbi:conjugal transfer protein TraE [Enterococcus raffinosus]|uniref:VirB4 family type IV secretion/conjugal transfer ATPase n=1 Tax=Enterococcus raffinosus TaxID=71452 RepID=UPI0020A02D4F|nr:conjugal transfer protein TraE [Enterococcus raffinosus]